jgi:hypothetical protein
VTSFPLDRIRPLYGFLDPAGPKRRIEALKHVAARSALIVAGADDLGRVFCVSAWGARCSTDALMERMEDTCDRFKLKLLGCEENALAGLFADAVRRDARLRNRVLPLVGITQPPNVEKDYRIRTTLQPLIGNGRLFLLGNDSGMMELRIEITTFPMNARKDMIDALASLCRLMPLKSARFGYDEEHESYLRYLRESGARPEVIEAEAARATDRRLRSPAGTRVA